MDVKNICTTRHVQQVAGPQHDVQDRRRQLGSAKVRAGEARQHAGLVHRRVQAPALLAWAVHAWMNSRQSQPLLHAVLVLVPPKKKTLDRPNHKPSPSTCSTKASMSSKCGAKPCTHARCDYAPA